MNLVPAMLASGYQKLLAMRKIYSLQFGRYFVALAEMWRGEWMLKYTVYWVETGGKKQRKILRLKLVK